MEQQRINEIKTELKSAWEYVDFDAKRDTLIYINELEVRVEELQAKINHLDNIVAIQNGLIPTHAVSTHTITSTGYPTGDTNEKAST